MEVLPVDFVSVPRSVFMNSLTGWLSSTSFTFKDKRMKLVDKRFMIKSVYTGETIPIGKACAEWMKDRGFKFHPMKREDYHNTIKYPPLYARVGYSKDENFAYYDLKAAYPSIYTRLRWGDEMVSGKWARRGEKDGYLWDFPYLDHKLARNAITGMWRGGKSHYYEEGRLQETKTVYATANYHIIAVMMMVLHDISMKAKQLGFVYWNTDGGIGDLNAGTELTQWVAFEWGLNLRPKHFGACEIRGIGDYTIGSKRTKNTSRRIKAIDRIITINSVDRERLKFLLEDK